MDFVDETIFAFFREMLPEHLIKHFLLRGLQTAKGALISPVNYLRKIFAKLSVLI